MKARRSPWRRSAFAGGAIILLIATLGVLGPVVSPWRGAAGRWHDLSYWQDSPRAAPPAWIRGAAGRQENTAMAGIPNSELLDSGFMKATWTLGLADKVGAFPGTGVLIVHGSGSMPLLVMGLAPDGTRTELAREVLELAPGEPVRITLDLAGLSGLAVTAFLPGGGSLPAAPELRLPRGTAGLLGTDAAKRDIFVGIALGTRWALLLGVVVSFVTIASALALALAAACLRGWPGALINRLYEFFALMPMLPVLMALSAVFKPSLWLFAVLAMAFFWTRSFKPFYAQALQARAEDYVEASRAIGAGRFRRATRHLLPGLLPLAFSNMALAVPGIILAEAGVSLLGLGDSGVVTWGQMLHDALVQGAVVNRLWWWVLPPGLMIALVSLAFALVGRAFELSRDSRH